MSEGANVNLVVPPSVSPTKKKSLDEYLSDLKKQRGNLKGRITQFKKYVDALDVHNLPFILVAELKLRMQSVTEVFQKFHVIESEIELRSSDSEIPNNIEYVESLESLYFKAMAAANCLVESGKTGDNAQKHLPSTSNVKLPDIKLPSFDGSYDRWLEFRNSYVTIIHKRPDLDDIQKFHYLRSSLTGSALQVISALEFTSLNYIHAWELLEIRFHNTRLLVNNHIHSLFTIVPNKQESALQIRKLIDTILRNLRALKTLDEPTESWDTLIIYLIVSKLDPSTEREWENHKGSIASNCKVKLDDLLSFLRNRADMLEMINANKIKSSSSTARVHSYVSTNTSDKPIKNNNSKLRNHSCAYCNKNHGLYACINFLNLTVNERLKFVIEKRLCHNCLRSGHAVNECLFGPCKQCEQKHNSLLHTNSSNHQYNDSNACVRSRPSAEPGAIRTHSDTSTALHSLSADCNTSNFHAKTNALRPVLLSTALVEVADNNNQYFTVKALLDNGSQHCFISEKLSKRLNTLKIQSTVHISGVGQSVTHSNYLCDISMRSKLNDFSTRIKCFILPCITSSLPSMNIDTDLLDIPHNIRLADPSFYVPSEIDLLIGADIFWDLLDSDKIRLPNGPHLQSSKLGWLISGPIQMKDSHNFQVQCNFTQCTLDSQLRKFWELEDLTPTSPCALLTEDERKCEKLFADTTKRDEAGRFSVRIPLRESADALGDSYTLAKKRFLSLERKLEQLPEFKHKYTEFMREYKRLEHMTKVEPSGHPNFYLPHHGVFRDSSTTTKLRVVFNASALTSTNKSLNDIQLPGPALQNDIFSILLRFRQYQFVACADVEKMFRQVLIQPDQRALQLILWRENPTDTLDTYQLNTVTYGTASAPFLSMRCIRQLALECDDDVISRIILNDFFVDDLITGSDNFDELLINCEKISQVLQSGCFPLRKWNFNSDISQDNLKELFTDEHSQNKTLGLGWHNLSDELHFTTKIEFNFNESKLNKRNMLSVISQIYDPLGLLSPVVIIAKCLLQKLWLSKVDWDTPVSKDIVSEWKQFICTLKLLNDLRIPRHVRSIRPKRTELHIFSDASQTAYGACAYIKTFDDDSNISVRLLCAKSKVAPLKSISIPRLELCGALIGARLYKKVVDSLRLNFDKVFFWTDSTIVMGWIRMSPHLLKTFVQNRVSEINELTGDSMWLHVSTKDNPADLLSRGLNLDLLIDCCLWWNGPAYLNNAIDINQTAWDSPDLDKLPDLKCTTVTYVSTTCDSTSSFVDFDRFSSFNKLKRIYAYVFRFIHNARAGKARKQDRQTGSLSVSELNASLQALVRCAQQQSFPSVYNNLLNNLPVKSNNKQFNRISGLNVFLDENKVIRVGGRLCNSSSFSYDKKHPILLCCKHQFTVLLLRNEHKRLLHASPQLLLANVREGWWPLSARNLVRKIVRDCVTCTRMKGKTLSPIMGNLPSERLEGGFPFMQTGVDYAGPVYILNRKGRGARLTKAYICLFVCFATRAIHLELVTSLTTNDYILSLKRFISRRGKPKIIFSDNGKNFVGAEKEFPLFLHNNSHQITDFTATDGIQLKFIPPYSAHFGGLWESGVRSCKYHLGRIVGNANLTYEEFSTALTQIEAVLNSRPMSPLSTDPADLSPLTPAHFLIGRPLTATACEDLTAKPTTRLTRYDRVEQLRQHFWQRWSKEYMAELQTRTKWKTMNDDIILDSLVLIKDDGLPPLKWKLGRVMRVFPGADGVSRVADIRTASGVIRRAFSKLCPLPAQPEAELITEDQLEGGASKAGGMFTPTTSAI